jgi:hypothetical protein
MLLYATDAEAQIRKYVTPGPRFASFSACDVRAVVRRDRLDVP